MVKFELIVLLYYLGIGLWGLLSDPTSILTFSCWMFILQGLYFLSVFFVSDYIKKIILNMIFAPSVFVLVYWFFPPVIPWYLDIAVHGVNILFLFYMVYKYPVIGTFDNALDIVLPIILPVVYFIFAIIYTYTTMSLIYPYNFFGFEEIEGKTSYVWQSIFLGSYVIAFIHAFASNISTVLRI